MVLVIKSQSEPLSPRVGIESWHQEPSSRKGVNKLWPMGQAQLSVYIKFYWNRAAPTTPLGTVYGCFHGVELGICYRNYIPPKPKVFIMWLFTEKKNQEPSSPGLEKTVVKIPVIYKLETEKIIIISIQQCQTGCRIQHFLQFKNMGKTIVLLTVPDNI